MTALYFLQNVWLHDIQHINTRHNNIQHNDTQHKGVICDTQHEGHSASMTITIKTLCIVSHYAKCRYAECQYAECRGA